MSRPSHSKLSGEVDVLNLLGRSWTLLVSPTKGEHAQVAWNPEAIPGFERVGWTAVEVVPAEQLRGAVARIRELEAALDEAADHLRNDGHYELSAAAFRLLETEWGQ